MLPVLDSNIVAERIAPLWLCVRLALLQVNTSISIYGVNYGLMLALCDKFYILVICKI